MLSPSAAVEAFRRLPALAWPLIGQAAFPSFSGGVPPRKTAVLWQISTCPRLLVCMRGVAFFTRSRGPSPTCRASATGTRANARWCEVHSAQSRARLVLRLQQTAAEPNVEDVARSGAAATRSRLFFFFFLDTPSSRVSWYTPVLSAPALNHAVASSFTPKPITFFRAERFFFFFPLLVVSTVSAASAVVAAAVAADCVPVVRWTRGRRRRD